MSEKKSCTGRDSAEALAAILGYTDKFRAIENRWHLRLARKLFPIAMAKRDAREQKKFVEDMKKFKKRVAHAAKGKI
jgi:hypothetical protein